MNPIKLFYIFIIFFSFFAKANEHLIWLSNTSDIVDNFYSKENTSLDIETSRLILKKLNYKDFELKIASYKKIKRLMAEVSIKTTHCVTNRIKKPEREKTQLFSQPLYLYPNIKVYYTGEKQTFPKHALNQKGELVALTSLFNTDSDYVLSIENDRSYGNFLDPQISLIPKQKISILTSNNSEMIAMLLRHEIKYTLIFPTDFRKKLINIRKHQYNLNSLGIAGNPPYIFSRIACTKTPLGKKVIADINRIINKIYLSEYFYKIHTEFLPKNEHFQLKKDLDRLISNNELL